ncbi:MAG: NAD(P)/FAD-dependent oxidoreductase [Candidatus Aminicenantes bacterium]|nr:NAD(P)/FAD-dependent oxidoreductase [Candidatus Aminicenantes bacterium]
MKTIAIIGSGIGGLTAGNLLARKGHKVTIFEAHSSPGGYTAGFRRSGFYFESGTLSFESSDVVFPAMKEIGVFDKVEFVRQKMGIIAPEINGVCSSYEDFKNLAYDAYPAEKDSLDRYFGAADKMIRTMFAVARPKGLGAFLTYPFHLARMITLYQKYNRMTTSDFAARCFGRGTELFRFFKDLGYPDMSAALIGPAFASFFGDYWTVRTGMQSWADALAENFRSLGGELKLGAKVDKIVTRDGTAVGVESRGEFHPADWVISGADYKKTFLEWLDNKALLPDAMRDKIAKAAVSEGITTVYLGLDIPADELGKCLQVPHVSYTDAREDVDVRTAGNDPDFFRKIPIALYSPSLHDERLTPQGKSGLMIQAVSPYRWMDNWGGEDRQIYRELKEKVKEALIARASTLIPDLADHIEFSDLATPRTYERYTGNTDGATSAWSWNPNNKFYKSIMSIKIDTPVRNLLIGSCWSCQIGGVPSAIGAARKCAKRIA